MLARRLLVSVCAVLFATVSHAEESIEEITVTGSYIRGTPEDAPSPEFKVSDFPCGQPDFDAAGFINNDPTRRLTQSMPDLKGNVGLHWLYDRHTARLSFCGKCLQGFFLRIGQKSLCFLHWTCVA